MYNLCQTRIITVMITCNITFGQDLVTRSKHTVHLAAACTFLTVTGLPLARNIAAFKWKRLFPEKKRAGVFHLTKLYREIIAVIRKKKRNVFTAKICKKKKKWQLCYNSCFPSPHPHPTQEYQEMSADTAVASS